MTRAVDSRSLDGPGVDCSLRLERTIWEGEEVPPERSPLRAPYLMARSLESRRRPLLTDALTVTETFRRRLLGVAKRSYGPDGVPSRLSARRADGRHLRKQHEHLHFLVAAGDEREIDALVAWCPTGLTDLEADIVEKVSLPPLCGEAVRLRKTEAEPFSASARSWRSHTPFLPTRHPKRRGGRTVQTFPDQVTEELERRGHPRPRRIEPVDGPWSSFRIIRSARNGSFPALGAHGFRIEFEDEVQGPISAGRNSHFGMGLFLPETSC